MNKKIKIIDIFNKIEKHEDIPKNIKFQDCEYVFKHTNYSIDHLYELKESCIGWLEHKDINLFDEVEILENNTEKIEELAKMNFFELVTDEVKTAMAMEKIKLKVDELVKVVNKMMKEGKEQ